MRERDEEFLSGPSDLADRFLDIADALGIDTDHLINRSIIVIFPICSSLGYAPSSIIHG